MWPVPTGDKAAACALESVQLPAIPVLPDLGDAEGVKAMLKGRFTL